jgi:hypothetical protein
MKGTSKKLKDVEPAREYLAIDHKYTGWKLCSAWAGGIVGSWALMIGLVVITRALLA